MTTTATAIFAFRRPAHLRQVLDSLLRQSLPLSGPVYIFLDGPRSEADADAVARCLRTARDYSSRLPLVICAATANRGLYQSLTEGIRDVLCEHARIIVLEDDIVVSPYFNQYMIAGLDCYHDQPGVASVHGYLPPLTSSLPDTFFLRGADCWGWATWRDRWSLYRHDAAAMAQEIRARGLAKAFNLGGRVPNLRLLDLRAAGKSRSWAICWHASCFLSECYTLHPGRSLVRNIGLDASGEHCVPSPALEASLTHGPVPVAFQAIREDPAIVSAFSRQYAAPSPWRRLLNRLALIRQLPILNSPTGP